MMDCSVASFHTGVNFIEKSECGATVRFVRVTYVRRGLDDSSDTPSTAVVSSDTPFTVAVSSDPPSTAVVSCDYSPPKGFSYKTFVPSPVKVAMCSGAPVYESFASTWERARVWLRLVGQLHSPVVLLLTLSVLSDDSSDLVNPLPRKRGLYATAMSICLSVCLFVCLSVA